MLRKNTRTMCTDELIEVRKGFGTFFIRTSATGFVIWCAKVSLRSRSQKTLVAIGCVSSDYDTASSLIVAMSILPFGLTRPTTLAHLPTSNPYDSRLPSVSLADNSL
mmetsp:Transcript_23622/g.40078  ORF Transcript_23622/g.40078 Transcript_23622/m.40078 type:complete len:107 (-) Transcript_23622:135-455(-)